MSKLRQNTRKMKILQGLATGRTYTFAEFRDELIEKKDEVVARYFFQFLGRRGQRMYNVKIETTPDKTHTRYFATIRCVNTAELAQRIAAVGSKKPSNKKIQTVVSTRGRMSESVVVAINAEGDPTIIDGHSRVKAAVDAKKSGISAMVMK